MRAVNLIPEGSPQRDGPEGLTGNTVYVVLGALAALLVLVTMMTLAGRSVSEKRSDLTRAQAEATEAEIRLRALDSGSAAAVAREATLASVRGLAASRYDWAGGLDALARALPRRTWLLTIDGTSPVAGTERDDDDSAPAGPSMTITGCTPTQASVALLVPRLRSLPGVVGVSLTSSTKPAQGGEAPRNGATDGCNGVTFTAQIGYAPRPAAAALAPPPAPGTPGAQAPAAPATAEAPQGEAPPPGAGG